MNPSINLFLGLILGCTFIAYLGIFQNEFVNFDDDTIILNNPLIEHAQIDQAAQVFNLHWQSPHYKPLVYLSWLIESSIFGLDPVVFHLNNLLLHAANGLLVFFLMQFVLLAMKLKQADANWLAFFSALIFLLHPMHVESVAWAVERKDVLFAFFFLAGLLSYTRYTASQKVKWLILAAVCYAAAVLSKSMAITMITMVVLIDLLLNRSITKRLILEKVPFLLVMLGAFFCYGMLFNFSKYAGGLTEGVVAEVELVARDAENLLGLPALYKRFLIVNFRLLLFALHLILPIGLSVIYSQAKLIESVGSFIHLVPLITIVLVGATIYFRKMNRFVFFGLAWFFLTLLPALSIPGEGTNFLSDRYTYIPAIGLFFALIVPFWQVLTKQKDRAKTGIAVLIGLCLLYMVATHDRVADWRTSETLWTDLIQKNKGKEYDNLAIAFNGRGRYYSAQADSRAALADFTKAIEINAAYYRAYLNRSIEFTSLGEMERSIKDCERAISLEPDNPRAYVNKSEALLALKKHQEAAQTLSKALIIQPDHTKALNNRGLAYYNLRKYNDALSDLNRAIDLDQNYVKALGNRATVHAQIGDRISSIKDLDRYVALDQSNALVFNMRGVLNFQENNLEAAERDYSAAIRLDPNNGQYYLNRARVYQNLGKAQKMKQDAQVAQRAGVQVPAQMLN